MPKILVTGHKGYIGSHFFDGSRMGGCDLKEGADFGDLSGNAYDTVVHLAAFVSVMESFQKPDEYFTNNCLKLSRFLEHNSVQRLIFVSTGGAMYGNKRLAVEGDARWENCASPYAQSKYLAEMAVRQQIPNHVILRLGNVYGGNTAVRGEANVHTHFAESNPIRVYGGRQTRDFIHVEDVCSSLRKALDSKTVGTFNIGSGEETPIKELAEKFSAERRVPIVYEDERPGEVQYVSLNVAHAREAGLL